MEFPGGRQVPGRGIQQQQASFTGAAEKVVRFAEHCVSGNFLFDGTENVTHGFPGLPRLRPYDLVEHQDGLLEGSLGVAAGCFPSERLAAAVIITTPAATARAATSAADGARGRHDPESGRRSAHTSSAATGMPSHHSNQPTSHTTTGSIR